MGHFLKRRETKVSKFKNLGLEVPNLGSDSGFRDGLGLRGDLVRGATRLPGKFS